MSWRTSLAGIPAGLAFMLSAFSQPGPWTVGRIALVVGGALLAAFGVVARDHAAPQITLTPEQRAMLRAAAQPALKAPSEDGKADA